MVVKNAAEGHNYLPPQQPASCPRHCEKLCICPAYVSSKKHYCEHCGHVELLHSKSNLWFENYTRHQNNDDDYDIIIAHECTVMLWWDVFKCWAVSCLKGVFFFFFFLFCFLVNATSQCVLNPTVCVCRVVCLVRKVWSTDTLQWQTCSTLANPKWNVCWPRKTRYIVYAFYIKLFIQYGLLRTRVLSQTKYEMWHEATTTPPILSRGFRSGFMFALMAARGKDVKHEWFRLLSGGLYTMVSFWSSCLF